METERKNWLGEHWLTLLLAAQPLLDALAYWQRNGSFTPAGLLRLTVLIVLPLFILLRRPGRGFCLGLAVIGGFCLLHLANDFRLGFLSPWFELSYLLRVVQMPVLCLCFVQTIRDEQTKAQALRGLRLAAILTALFIPLAWVSGTGNVTYGPGLGYSGWVIDDNRCAHSILLVTLSAFALYFAHQSGRRWLTALIPPLVGAYLFTNGTKACYYGLFVLCGGFAAYLLLEKLLLKKNMKTLLLLSLVLTMAAAAVFYPVSPRYRVDQRAEEALSAARLRDSREREKAGASGAAPGESAKQREYLEKLYRRCLGEYPELYRRFGMERVWEQYHYTRDLTVLRDARRAERAYARMIREDGDTLTKLLGFEASQMGVDGHYDLENDWPALFYYYGDLGFALYAGFVLAFLLRALRALLRDFRGSLTPLNFTLLLCVSLQLGLAQYSGALLRRPNVSIYLSLALALLWYQTREKEVHP